MKICPVCKQHFPDEAKFCPKDGIELNKLEDDLIGREILGQFIILEKIGHGTMGNVYMAKQTTIDRKVAIKILKPKLAADPDVITRFNREAKAVARLNHPNIVTVHLVGKLEPENLPYMIMEYVEGASLEHVCVSQGALPPERTVLISLQIAAALMEAHNNHVVHRDLKPANIVVWDQGTSKESIKVLDFGIAKILHTDEERSRLTKTGTIFGTPAYISPEQAAGETLDNRSDLYSLGVIMYRLATGRLPFEDASGLEILVRHIRDLPPRPSSVNPSVPPELEAIILKLLEKNKEDRYPSAEALVDDLKSFRSSLSEGTSAVPASVSSSTPYQMKSPDKSQETTEIPVSSTEEPEILFKKSRTGLLALLIPLALLVLLLTYYFLIYKPSESDSDVDEEVNVPVENRKQPKDVLKKPERKPESAFKKPVVAREVPKETLCSFSLDLQKKKIRQVCAGHTTDVKIKSFSLRRKKFILHIYTPGLPLTDIKILNKPETFPKLTKKVFYGNNNDEVSLFFKFRKRNKPLFLKLKLAKQSMVFDIEISFSKQSASKHRRTGSSRRKSNELGIPITPIKPTGVIQPLLPKNPEPVMKPANENDLPALDENGEIKKRKAAPKEELLEDPPDF